RPASADPSGGPRPAHPGYPRRPGPVKQGCAGRNQRVWKVPLHGARDALFGGIRLKGRGSWTVVGRLGGWWVAGETGPWTICAGSPGLFVALRGGRGWCVGEGVIGNR